MRIDNRCRQDFFITETGATCYHLGKFQGDNIIRLVRVGINDYLCPGLLADSNYVTISKGVALTCGNFHVTSTAGRFPRLFQAKKPWVSQDVHGRLGYGC